MKLPDKNWFTLDEVALRWGCTTDDLFHYAMHGQLNLTYEWKKALLNTKKHGENDEKMYLYWSYYRKGYLQFMWDLARNNTPNSELVFRDAEGAIVKSCGDQNGKDIYYKDGRRAMYSTNEPSNSERKKTPLKSLSKLHYSQVENLYATGNTQLQIIFAGLQHVGIFVNKIAEAPKHLYSAMTTEPQQFKGYPTISRENIVIDIAERDRFESSNICSDGLHATSPTVDDLSALKISVPSLGERKALGALIDALIDSEKYKSKAQIKDLILKNHSHIHGISSRSLDNYFSEAKKALDDD